MPLFVFPLVSFVTEQSANAESLLERNFSHPVRNLFPAETRKTLLFPLFHLLLFANGAKSKEEMLSVAHVGISFFICFSLIFPSHLKSKQPGCYLCCCQCCLHHGARNEGKLVYLYGKFPSQAFLQQHTAESRVTKLPRLCCISCLCCLRQEAPGCRQDAQYLQQSSITAVHV